MGAMTRKPSWIEGWKTTAARAAGVHPKITAAIQKAEREVVGFRSCFGDFARDIVRAFAASGVFFKIFAHLRLFS